MEWYCLSAIDDRGTYHFIHFGGPGVMPSVDSYVWMALCEEEYGHRSFGVNAPTEWPTLTGITCTTCIDVFIDSRSHIEQPQ